MIGRQFPIDLKDERYGNGKYETTILFPNLETYGDWKIGSLYGPSGTGKSTILDAMFGIPQYDMFTEGKPIDHISENILIAVGLMSIPSWYTNIESLSGGERERFKIACILSNSKSGDTIVIDEFTSLVDRATARGMACGISKWCRRQNRKLIIASINNDIFPFMQPDFIWSTRYNKFITYTKEELKLEFVKGSYDDWSLFEKYHYLSTKLFTGSTITLALINTEPVAFIAVNFLMQHGRRIHRLVVLPEWQGLGIGTKLLEHVANEETIAGSKIYIKTSHPAIGHYLESSSKWVPSTHNLKIGNSHPWYDQVRKIPCWCYRYNDNLDTSPDITKTLNSVSNITKTLNSASNITKTLNSVSNITKTLNSVSNITETVSNARINSKNSWDCLIRKGKIKFCKNKYVYTRKNHPTTYFDTFQQAYDAQTELSILTGCNPYKIVNDKVIIKIKNSLGTPEHFYANVSIKFLETIKGRTWFIRHMATGPHARSKINGNHVYLEDICGLTRNKSNIIHSEDPSNCS